MLHPAVRPTIKRDIVSDPSSIAGSPVNHCYSREIHRTFLSRQTLRSIGNYSHPFPKIVSDRSIAVLVTSNRISSVRTKAFAKFPASLIAP